MDRIHPWSCLFFLGVCPKYYRQQINIAMSAQEPKQNKEADVTQQDNASSKPANGGETAPPAPEQEVGKEQKGVESSAGETAGDTQEMGPADELAKVRQENASLQEDLLRAKAETQNTIRRMQSESKINYQRGMATVLESMITVVDDLERAAGVKTDNHQALLDGVAMTLNQFTNVLSKQGLATIDPAGGEKFDPNLHMALSEERNDKIEPKCVIRTVMKGYSLQARVLRPASVVVSIAATTENNDKG